jgi:hypothetical protein
MRFVATEEVAVREAQFLAAVIATKRDEFDILCLKDVDCFKIGQFHSHTFVLRFFSGLVFAALVAQG